MKIQPLVLACTVALCAGSTAVVTSAADKVGLMPMASQPSRADAPMPPLDGAVEWLNSRPLTSAGLRGKVVLVDFWTYTCINWQRTLPHVRAWAEKYRDKGLVVIGVHTPEFSFEHDLDNIRRAVTELKVGYPVAVDSRYAIWRAFNNDAWPAPRRSGPRGPPAPTPPTRWG